MSTVPIRPLSMPEARGANWGPRVHRVYGPMGLQFRERGDSESRMSAR